IPGGVSSAHLRRGAFSGTTSKTGSIPPNAFGSGEGFRAKRRGGAHAADTRREFRYDDLGMPHAWVESAKRPKACMFDMNGVAALPSRGVGPGWRSPMTKLSHSQRDELKRRLTSRRQTLRADVQRELANSDDPRVTGFMNQLAATEDWVLADILADLDIATVTRDVAELAEVEAALTQIADESY